jgi:hypothetical protein
MGSVGLDESGNFVVHMQAQAEVAALRTALRCANDPDPVELPEIEGTAALDANHVEHVLAIWACDFRGTAAALHRAVSELAPYVRQSTALHSSLALESQQRMMRNMSARCPTPPPPSAAARPPA